MSQKRTPWKIYQDEVKERQTTHWDMDYIPAAEYAAIMGEQLGRRQATAQRRRQQRLALVLGLGAALLISVGTFILLISSP